MRVCVRKSPDTGDALRGPRGSETEIVSVDVSPRAAGVVDDADAGAMTVERLRNIEDDRPHDFRSLTGCRECDDVAAVARCVGRTGRRRASEKRRERRIRTAIRAEHALELRHVGVVFAAHLELDALGRDVNEAALESDCGLGCFPTTLNERYAAYCVRHGITPHELVRWRDAPGIWDHYRWVKTVWDEWQRMSGTNDPLRRHVFGNRDFDVNIDGVAYYGMLPDFLQDVANSHPRPAEVGAYLDPLFRSAESYIHMWEKARLVAGRTDADP
jgi:hypothetical protein